MKTFLSKKGFRVVGEFHCRGFDTFGPLLLMGGIHRQHPNQRDRNHAEEFARQLGASFHAVEPGDSVMFGGGRSALAT